MKYLPPFVILLLLATACMNREPQNLQTAYTPVLMERSDLENSIKIARARPMKDAGKIYRYQNLLFINEKFEGVHVYDNSDPTDPKMLGFLKIPGNVDIAMQNGILYADNATDLVAIEYDLQQLNVLSRTTNVFPEITPPDGGGIPEKYLPENRPANTVIVKWVEK